jgi:hypothetical protein
MRSFGGFGSDMATTLTVHPLTGSVFVSGLVSAVVPSLPLNEFNSLLDISLAVYDSNGSLQWSGLVGSSRFDYPVMLDFYRNGSLVIGAHFNDMIGVLVYANSCMFFMFFYSFSI